jgi:hypothetical protein
MNDPRFENLTDEEQDWIDAVLDETIDEESFVKLQARMLEKPELRAVMRRSLSLHNDLHEKADEAGAATDSWLLNDPQVENVITMPQEKSRWSAFPLALAAGFAFMLGLASMYFGRSPVLVEQPTMVEKEEQSANGFAVMGNLFDAQWAPENTGRRRGDSLGGEVLKLESGVAEVQFFSGATMIIQGPAEIALKSAWEATCHDGVVRMRVPPAARGFTLHGPATEIVDLGTEFGLEVRNGQAHVEVLDGEISFKHRNGQERIVEKGGAWGLPEDGTEIESEIGKVAFPELGGFDLQARSLLQKDFERWQVHSREFARDDRMIAYYTFDRAHPTAVVASLAEPRSSEFDGAVVLAETAAGRWPGMKQALEFRRPGSRVRVRIPGEFQAFTFAAWVRIDSLDRRYNALFMGDGYENGEPHWQIRDDGKLMFSVMVDDSRSLPHHPQSRFHHVYFSPSIWDLSKSGQWIHLVSVYDPQSKRATHHVNGKKVSEEAIQPEFHVDTLRIGNGEIGNWGQPFRETPWFAIRNLNGRIDELAILKTALTDQEVTTIYERSRAAHH